MIGDYRQTTWIEGQQVALRDLRIQRGRNQRTLTMDFRSDSMIDSNIEALLVVGNEFRAQIKVGTDSRDYYGDIASVHRTRGTNYTQFRVDVEGREARLQRRRFSGQWLDMTAKAILDDAFSKFGGGLGLTFSPGPEAGPTIAEMVINEGTLYELFEKVTGLADWAWSVDNTTLKTWNPLTAAKGREIDQGALDVSQGTIDLREDAKRIQNVMRGVAYETRTIQQSHDVDADSCISALHFGRPGGVWESTGALAEFDGELISGSVNLEDGKFVFSSPFSPGESGTIRLNVQIRRPVVFEIKDDPSIAEYGPRYGPTYKDDGGMSVDAVKAIMQATIDRLKVPEISLSLGVERWPFDAEIRCDVTLSDPAVTKTMVIDSINITSSRRDAEIRLDMVDVDSRRASQEPDPAVVMAKRIEDLERKGFHPGSDIGWMLNEIGLLSFDQYTEVWEHSDEWLTGLVATFSDGSDIVWSDGNSMEWSAG